MQLGVSSYAFGWAVGVAGFPPPVPFTELDLLAFARSHGLRVVQFGDHVPLHTFDAGRLARLRDEAGHGTGGITLEIGARGLTPDHLDRYIGLARELRAPLLRFVIDGPGHEPSAEEVVRILRESVPTLESAQVTLGLENHDRFPARILRMIVERVASPRVGICLDTANSLGAGEGLEQVLHELGPYTVNLHVKDFTIARLSHAMGFLVEGCPAGAGRLEVRELIADLRKYGRCGSAILETWIPPEATLPDTLAKERRWVEQSLAYLKPLFSAS